MERTSKRGRRAEVERAQEPVEPDIDVGAEEEIAPIKLTISPPKMETAVVEIVGVTPYVGNKMSARSLAGMRKDQEEGSPAANKKKREPKKFDSLHIEASHISTEGWYGIPTSAFRLALVDACRLSGFKMTMAKMVIFVEPDGFDKDDGQPLVKIISKQKEPRPFEMAVRLKGRFGSSTDIAVRPQWLDWACRLQIKWDTEQATRTDILNLAMRVGEQLGIGAGRPFSKNSVGLGFGTFRVTPIGRGR